MSWNWQLPDWPTFTYQSNKISAKERLFLLSSGKSLACLKNINENERNQFIVEILSLEGIESSKIEGEFLERKSLQSSIRQHFGLENKSPAKQSEKECGMAELLCHVYATYDKPLTHEMLWNWHSMLFRGESNLTDIGVYRTHADPMQIVSNHLDSPKVFFEAPPSSDVFHEMTRFIDWFNSNEQSELTLGRAALAHLYFESIHPFEDGNGRIGRILVEKVLSQGIGQPALIAVSKFIEKKKKNYYNELGKCNQSLEASNWVEFFASTILESQEDSIRLLYFLINKSKIFASLSEQLNPRQEKALLKMFAQGIEGFAGGLSAEKYIAITKTSKATATRDLTDLVQKGALVKTGELRHSRYWLNLEI